VGGLKSRANLIGPVEGCRYGHGAAKRFAFHQLQHQAFDASGVFEAVNGPNVRMIQRRQRASFASEAGQARRVSREFAGNILIVTSRPSLLSFAR